MHACPPTCSKCETYKKSLFSVLKPEHTQFLEKNLSHKTYKKGQTVFHQGNQPQGLYCIHTGKLKLYRQGLTDRNTIVRLAGPGEVVGYRALFSGEDYSASAQAMEDTDICFIEKRVIDQLLRNNPELAFALLRKLSTDLRASETRFQRKIEAHLRERIAELLIYLKDQYGTTHHEQAEVINVKLSRQDIADILGTTVESVIRQISSFKKDNLTTDINHYIQILDEPKLREIAKLDI